MALIENDGYKDNRRSHAKKHSPAEDFMNLTFEEKQGLMKGNHWHGINLFLPRCWSQGRCRTPGLSFLQLVGWGEPQANPNEWMAWVCWGSSLTPIRINLRKRISHIKALGGIGLGLSGVQRTAIVKTVS